MDVLFTKWIVVVIEKENEKKKKKKEKILSFSALVMAKKENDAQCVFQKNFLGNSRYNFSLFSDQL